MEAGGASGTIPPHTRRHQISFVKKPKTIVTITPLAVEADTRTFKQAASMARMGHISVVLEGKASRLGPGEVPFTLVSPKGSRSPAGPTGSPSAPPQGPLARLKLLVSKTPLVWIWNVARYVWPILKRCIWVWVHAPRGDLYYLHDFHQFPAVYLLCRRYGAPFIYDAHDFYSRMEEAWDLSLELRYIIRPWERWLERQCINNAAAVVTVCDSIAELHRSVFQRKSLVVRNCQDLRLAPPPSRDIRRHLGLGPEDFILLTLGNDKKGSATRELLQAVWALPENLHAVFLGRYYQDHDEFVLRHRIAHRVHLMEPVMPFEVENFIRTADAVIILYYPRSINYVYSLPNKFFHAIAAGLPLLYPDLPEIRQLAERFQVGLPIDPRRPDTIIGAVKTLLEQPEKLAELRRNVAVARETLNWAEEERILLDIVSNLL